MTLIQRDGTATSDQTVTKTATLIGCLEKTSGTNGYMLTGPNSDEWMLKSDAVDLSAYCYRRAKVTILKSP